MITAFRIIMLLFAFAGFLDAASQKTATGIFACIVYGTVPSVLFLVSYLLPF